MSKGNTGGWNKSAVQRMKKDRREAKALRRQQRKEAKKGAGPLVVRGLG